MDKQQFLQKMQFLLNSRQGIVSYLGQFMEFDPQAGPTSVATQQAINALAEELKHRGMVETPRPTNLLSSNRHAVVEWVRNFASYLPKDSNIPITQQHDVALVPAVQAYETARESLRMYCRDRIEYPS